MPVSTSKVEAERLIEAKPEFHNFSASLSCRVRSCLKFTVLVFCVACSVAVIKYSDKNSLRERAFSSSQWRGLGGWGVGDDRLSVQRNHWGDFLRWLISKPLLQANSDKGLCSTHFFLFIQTSRRVLPISFNKVISTGVP